MTDPLIYGRDILRDIISELQKVAGSLDESFADAVSMLEVGVTAGRIVVTGIGKAGFIGMKISATFASIGLPSFFLHPAEAAHGDLGRLTSSDTVLVLTSSGETPEIVTLLPHLRRAGCKILTITSNDAATVSQHSDVTLCLGTLKEVGPLGLAPTTSTCAMLVLGDALAMTLLRRRGFTAEQFARLHPGGALGIRLSLVSEIMRQGEYHCVIAQDRSIREVITAISTTKGRPGAASIVSSDGKLVGIFTDGNLRRCLTQDADFLDRAVLEYMGRSPKCVRPSDLVQDALFTMQQHQIDQVIVIDDNNSPVGMVDIQDVFKVR